VAIISRYPFEYYAERHLKSQTSRMLLGFRRVSVMGEFDVPHIGLVRVVNVHFTNWSFEKRVREKQLKETLEWLTEREKQKPADMIVLGGDFNIKPGGSELKQVTQGQFAKKFRFLDFNTDDPTRGAKGAPKHRVDYIFVAARNRDVKITNADEQRLWVGGLTSDEGSSRFWLSDHVPVLHEYSLHTPAIAAARTSNDVVQ
jgi:endonuclease/exonuclease/phosphatase family metal-dependent hydrolase